MATLFGDPNNIAFKNSLTKTIAYQDRLLAKESTHQELFKYFETKNNFFQSQKPKRSLSRLSSNKYKHGSDHNPSL